MFDNNADGSFTIHILDRSDHGGWRYTEGMIKIQHVPFDNGFGNSIVDFFGADNFVTVV